MIQVAGAAGVLASGVFPVNNSIKADATFLRRIFLALVVATTVSGGFAAFTTVKAMNAKAPEACLIFCK
jgi:hypothetical protein